MKRIIIKTQLSHNEVAELIISHEKEGIINTIFNVLYRF